MRTKLWLVTRAVVCLILALTSLSAAPIYHAHYQGQATLTSGTLTCTDSIAFDDYGNVLGHSETCTDGSALGAFHYGWFPIYSLPIDSVLLSSEVHQWGYFDIGVFDYTLTVEPIDPAKPFIPGGFAGYTIATNVEAFYWPFQSGWVLENFRPGFDLLDTTLANESPAWASEVRVSLDSGPKDFSPYPGINSVTTQTRSFRIVGGAAFYTLDITYETAIPEPATAFPVLAGAAGLLLIRLVRR